MLNYISQIAWWRDGCLPSLTNPGRICNRWGGGTTVIMAINWYMLLVMLVLFLQCRSKAYESSIFIKRSRFRILLWQFGFGLANHLGQRAGHEICKSQTWKCDEGSDVTWPYLAEYATNVWLCFRWKIEQLGNSLSKGPFARVFIWWGRIVKKNQWIMDPLLTDSRSPESVLRDLTEPRLAGVSESTLLEAELFLKQISLGVGGLMCI
jgi:hypothetical protein